MVKFPPSSVHESPIPQGGRKERWEMLRRWSLWELEDNGVIPLGGVGEPWSLSSLSSLPNSSSERSTHSAMCLCREIQSHHRPKATKPSWAWLGTSKFMSQSSPFLFISWYSHYVLRVMESQLVPQGWRYMSEIRTKPHFNPNSFLFSRILLRQSTGAGKTFSKQTSPG